MDGRSQRTSIERERGTREMDSGDNRDSPPLPEFSLISRARGGGSGSMINAITKFY